MSTETPALALAKLIAAALAKEDLLASAPDQFAERLARGDISAEGWKSLLKVSIPKAGPP
jgi:hypothetical protein